MLATLFIYLVEFSIGAIAGVLYQRHRSRALNQLSEQEVSTLVMRAEELQQLRLASQRDFDAIKPPQPIQLAPPTPLTQAEQIVLDLKTNGASTAGEITSRLGLRRKSVAGRLSELVDSGVVQRCCLNHEIRLESPAGTIYFVE